MWFLPALSVLHYMSHPKSWGSLGCIKVTLDQATTLCFPNCPNSRLPLCLHLCKTLSNTSPLKQFTNAPKFAAIVSPSLIKLREEQIWRKRQRENIQLNYLEDWWIIKAIHRAKTGQIHTDFYVNNKYPQCTPNYYKYSAAGWIVTA